ncbi:MAG: hypothetical protein HC811_09525 [Flammeovirgaceae bacterium]|nr:hypothetical protein [Flammeovirgaceae bacterium]
MKKIIQLAKETKRKRDKRHLYSTLFEKYKEYTMIPRESFTHNLDLCNHYRDIPGDYVECGVWKGGMSAAIAEELGKEREVHLFDSFQGLPPVEEIDGKEAASWQEKTDSPNYYNNCKADEEHAIQSMRMAGHQNYQLYRGWFGETLPTFGEHPIAILRLDGDWYKSVLTCLEILFPKVVHGGIVILDDYYTWDGCSRAVHDYLSTIKSPSRIYQWKETVPYILKKN